MTSVFVALAATSGILVLWGLLAPRSQWRAILGWSVSDPHANEPSTTSYVIRQLLFVLGLGGIAFVGISAYLNYLDGIPEPAPPPTPVQQMWGGDPAPRMVNRVVPVGSSPPQTLVDTRILGYQEADEQGKFADYLLDLDEFALLGDTSPAGLIGGDPRDGFSGISTAELVVHIRGDLLCIPRRAIAIETETTVQIAVYFGLPDREDGETQDHLAACEPEPVVANSILLPIELAAPVGDRDVQYLDGSPIQRVPVVVD